MIELDHNQRVLHQWDKDQRVVIDGFRAGTTVEFSSRYDCKNSALPVASYEENGNIYADIPNALLQHPGYLQVYVRPSASDAETTPILKDFKIVRRDKPENYVYTETHTLSLESKVNRYWGAENKGKALVIGEDGYITTGEPASSGGSGNAVAEDDGHGNVTIRMTGVSVTDDGSGNVVIG